MYIPVSTYRVQLNSEFRFSDLHDILDYLSKLGISTIYAAPFLQSTTGSQHGYDVVNPESIDPELGSMTDLESVLSAMRQKKMSWLQDIVPNHMAYNNENIWLMDIFEKGKHSDYAGFFDIDWDHAELQDRILFPFLKNEHDPVVVSYNQKGFSIIIDKISYPASWRSYYEILSGLHAIRRGENTAFDAIRDLFRDIRDHYDDNQKVLNSLHLKEQLYEWYLSDNHQKIFGEALEQLNKNKDAIAHIVSLQFFKPVPVDTTDKQINYRRFFLVNGLICLKMESKSAFEKYHEQLDLLLKNRSIQGLRVDHIDGLYNPEEYFRSLREMAGDEVYIITEKILNGDERLQDWPIQGTSGYEFLGLANRLFINTANEPYFTEVYKNFSGNMEDYEKTVTDKKHFILTQKMQGELNNLLHKLRTSGLLRNHSEEKIKEALSLFMSSFPVYRTYVNSSNPSDSDKKIIDLTFEKAIGLKPELSEDLNYLHSILTGNGVLSDSQLKFFMRLQQYTGPMAAKGVEDTAFYIYNRLISSNEVGDSPLSFGISKETFHRLMEDRQKNLPLSLNASTTHDTKRGEDGRIRISMLSFIPGQWQSMLNEWAAINKKYKKKDSHGAEIPDRNDEYFIYQSLIGSFFPEDDQGVFLKRFKDFMTKAMREAKVHTTGEHPVQQYEKGTLEFIDAMLQDETFMKSFIPFLNKIIYYSVPHSLGLLLLKMTAPGIPDIYQGAELWELSLVDPDNRKHVDFEKREKYLEEILHLPDTDRKKYIEKGFTSIHDGKIKLFTTWITLQERLACPDLFTEGAYIPLRFSGRSSEYLFGYARVFREQWYIIVMITDAISCGYEKSRQEDIWGNTCVVLPDQAPDKWYHVITKQEYADSENTILIKDLLQDFPLAFLKN